MNRPVAIIFFLVATTPGTIRADDARQDLFSRIDNFLSNWQEGYVDTSVICQGETADIKVWWSGESERRERIDRESNPKLNDRRSIELRSKNAYCVTAPDLLTARCGRLIDGRDPLPIVRVRPNESWTEVLNNKSTRRWIEEPRLANTVLKLADDSFSFLQGRQQSDVDQVAVALRDQKELAELVMDGYVSRSVFNANGLLVHTSRIGNVPADQLNKVDVQVLWTSANPPALKKLVRRVSRDGGKTFSIDLQVNVHAATNKLPKDAPSLSIPPDDLPFGTRVTDSRQKVTKKFYVGGKEGEAHHMMIHAAREMKKLDSQ
ncbi:hypothetical protein [Rubripirellula reticaptiva]|uniref:Uncharacterized protein n=1 Tax=Rubripirellula reticaptiva TaxID=2528013 RepID=A0A5C6F6B4_9BACT|nr:hypothetical protein [Rubripirellula reticaptiva]TWU56074.1 hypothetical protein Poly59_23780 [Rubripirellula reticaptiva]